MFVVDVVDANVGVAMNEHGNFVVIIIYSIMNARGKVLRAVRS